MARVTIEDCLKEVDSRFALVQLAVRRVLQLRGGAPYLIENPKNKEVVVALREIAAGKVSPENVRQLEESKSRALPSPAAEAVARATEEVSRAEVIEILEEATQFDSAIEFGDVEPFEEEDSSPRAEDEE